jgi:hypothetical protein
MKLWDKPYYLETARRLLATHTKATCKTRRHGPPRYVMQAWQDVCGGVQPALVDHYQRRVRVYRPSKVESLEARAAEQDDAWLLGFLADFPGEISTSDHEDDGTSSTGPC